MSKRSERKAAEELAAPTEETTQAAAAETAAAHVVPSDLSPSIDLKIDPNLDVRPRYTGIMEDPNLDVRLY